MPARISVLVAGRHKGAIDALVAAVGAFESAEVSTRHISNGHTDPLHGVDIVPDVLVLRLSESWRTELDALAARTSGARPKLLVVAPQSSAPLMRHAMQAGARDFLFEPVQQEEIVAALQRVQDELAVPSEARGCLSVFINAKGGSGATFLACNVAYMLAAGDGLRTALVDLDVHFGTLPDYLDMKPQHDLAAVLADIDDLDATAMDAFMSKHPSGLHVLGSDQHPGLAPPINERRIGALLDLLLVNYDHVVIDVPRTLDAAAAQILERADHIMIVVQQSYANLRDAARLLQILREGLHIVDDRIHAVVNRYDKKSSVTLRDIRHVLKTGAPQVVPNDFRAVTESINAGSPLAELAPSAALTRSIRQLEALIGGAAVRLPERGLARRLRNILRTSP